MRKYLEEYIFVIILLLYVCPVEGQKEITETPEVKPVAEAPKKPRGRKPKVKTEETSDWMDNRNSNMKATI